MFRKLKEVFARWWGSSYQIGNTQGTTITDDDMYGWEPLEREAKSQGKLISTQKLGDIRMVSQYLYLFNCHYSGLVKTYRKYVFGKRFQVVSKNERENEVWKAFLKEIYWRKFVKEMGRRFFRDGEVFILVDGWRYINPALIQTPSNNKNENIQQGIEFEDGDTTRPLTYYISQGDHYLVVPAEFILHICDKDQDEVRGLPYFLATMAKAGQYDRWLNDRMLLNRIRASIAIIRKHKKATPTQVSTFADAKKTTELTDKTTSYGATLRRKIFEPGTIIDCGENDSYEYLEPKIRANDVAADGRSFLLSICAATGLPEFMVSGDSSNANYASTFVAESTGIKEFEDWQEFFADVFIEIWWRVMEAAGLEPADDPEIQIPSLVVRNRLDETKRAEILYQNGVISVEEWRRNEDIQNSEEIDKELDKEGKGDLQ